MKRLHALAAALFALMGPMAPAHAQSIDPSTGAMLVKCVASSCAGGTGGGANASSSAPSYTAGAQPLSMDLTGFLRVRDDTLAGLMTAPIPTQPSTVIIGGVGSYASADGSDARIIQAGHSAFLNMSTATTTKIITGTSAKKVYITHFRIHAGGTSNVKFVEGTGTNCGTGTADLSETFNLTASDGSNGGNGLGPILIAATAADDICMTSSAAVTVGIGVAYETH